MSTQAATERKMSKSERWAHIIVFSVIAGLFGFLGSMWWLHPPLPIQQTQTVSTATPHEEARIVIEQIVACLVDPKVPVGKPLLPIADGSPPPKGVGSFFYSMSGITYHNASGDYFDRADYCQASVK